MSQPKRLNLNVRLQPVEGTALAEVVKWLNEMSASEKNHKISQVLLMSWLPLARAYSGAEPEEIERTYWNYERWLLYHQSIIRDELKIQGSSPNENRLREKMPEIALIAEQEKQEKQEFKKSEAKPQEPKKTKKVTSIFSGLG